jgi:hypothetical protein
MKGGTSNLAGQMIYPPDLPGSDFANLTPPAIYLGTVLLHDSSGDVQRSLVVFHCKFILLA